MAGKAIFVNTNVLVYVSRVGAEFYAVVMTAFGQARDDQCPLWISRQVLREYLAAVTRPQPGIPPLPLASASVDIENFTRDFNIAEDGPRVTESLLAVLARHPAAGRQVHDANIVATMLTHGLRRLLTFNTSDFRRFAPVIDLVKLPAA